jgi:disulfide bond formation protein DsbB
MKRFFDLSIILLLIFTITLTACQGEIRSAAAAPSALMGDPATGQSLFMSTCAACHGPDGRGVPGLGKNLVESEFVTDKNDQELIEFIKTGRNAADPLNTTGVTMPPKGGRASLTDEDLYHIVAYLRSIHE